MNISFGSPSSILFSSFKEIFSYSLNGQLLSTLKLDNRVSAGIFVTTEEDHSQIAVVIDSDHNLLVLQLPFLKVITTIALKIDPPEAKVLSATYDQTSELIILTLSTGGLFLVAPKL